MAEPGTSALKEEVCTTRDSAWSSFQQRVCGRSYSQRS